MNEVLSEVVYWSGFFLFNSLFFIPNYLLHYPDASLLPQKWKQARKLGTGIGMEENPDIFRISIDLTVLMLIARYSEFVPVGALVGYFGVIWLFNLYYLVFKKIYEFDPIILNDVRLLKNGAGLLWGEDKVKFLGNVLAFLILCVFLIVSFRVYADFGVTLSPKLSTHVISGGLLILILVMLVKHGYKPYHSTHYRFLFVPMRLIQNVRDSFRINADSKNTNWSKLDQDRQSDARLVKRPNVYLIFVESYGSILLKEPELKTAFAKEFSDFGGQLGEAGWHMRSQLSESVSLVGPSWLAYTSVLLGQRVDSNFKYERLLNDERYHKYDTVTKFLQKRGYLSYNLNASKPKKGVATPLDQMANLYGVDQWILKEHIDFKGTKYGFTEGPSDQYVLNYGLEEVIRKQDEPFVLFYLTKNSHSPFISPDVVTSDWRDLNDGRDNLVGNHFLQKPVLSDYLNAIQYQLRFLSDFIVKQGEQDDIFMLIGDHQPHHLSDINKHGLDTLVHVISKDQQFINGFGQYGFVEGLSFSGKGVKHEALYSILISELIKAYGAKGEETLQYEPDGIQV